MCCYCWGFRAQVTGAMITPSTNAFAKAVRANLCIPIGYYQISIYEDLAKMDAHHTAIFVPHANGFYHRFSAPYMLRTNNMVYIHNSWDHYPGQHMPTAAPSFTNIANWAMVKVVRCEIGCRLTFRSIWRRANRFRGNQQGARSLAKEYRILLLSSQHLNRYNSVVFLIDGYAPVASWVAHLYCVQGLRACRMNYLRIAS